MIRCQERAGRFRVSIRINHQAPPYRVQILGHHDAVMRHPDGSPMLDASGRPVVAEAAPWVGLGEPYEGELCVHEIQWLTGTPGQAWRPEYEWTITPLDGALD